MPRFRFVSWHCDTKRDTSARRTPNINGCQRVRARTSPIQGSAGRIAIRDLDVELCSEHGSTFESRHVQGCSGETVSIVGGAPFATYGSGFERGDGKLAQRVSVRPLDLAGR